MRFSSTLSKKKRCKNVQRRKRNLLKIKVKKNKRKMGQKKNKHAVKILVMSKELIFAEQVSEVLRKHIIKNEWDQEW